MIYKIAITATTPVAIVESSKNESGPIVRTASSRLIIDRNSEQAKIVEAEIKKHPNALFFRSKAIEANRANTNGDYFSEEELLRAYKTFEGVPFFTNHDNQNVENARGKVIFAEWIPEEKAVYTISFVDRDAYPHICRSIEEEYVTGVSMGCSVEYSICNICGNRAEKTDDYCTHIRNRKARKFTGRAKNVVTGETKEFKDEPVFEYNFGIKFIELSAVVDPACPSCKIQGIIPNEDYMRKVANIQNELFMIKTAAMDKHASQEEIQQIEQVLQTLEKIAVNLIQNRKNVEMEFASDLVDILSQLQTWTDELIGAGYGNLPSAAVPGTAGNAPEQGMPQGAPPGGAAPMAAAAEMPMGTPEAGAMPSGGVGQVSGSPSKPLVSGPKLPISSPVKPKTADSRSVQRICAFEVQPKKYEPRISQRNETGDEIMRKAGNLIERVLKTGDIDMGKRRTITAKEEAREEAKQILSNSWKEKQDFFEYIKQVPSIQDNEFKLSVKKRDDSFIIVAEKKNAPDTDSMVWTFEDLKDDYRKLIKESPREAAKQLLETFANAFTNQKEGVNRMTDINKNAGASSVNANPEVITQKQLDQTGLYHERTGDEKHVITQKQLEDRRKGEKDYLTEKQLDDSELQLNPRTQEEVEVVQEAQMKGDNRKDDEKHVITQKQLDEQRTGVEQETITEDQLKSVDTPWARAAKRNPATFKTAKEHMDAVINVMANSVIGCGCTPEEVCEVAASMVDSTKNRYDLMTSIMTDAKEAEEVDYAKRAAFWNNKNLKVAGVGKREIASKLIDGLRKAASDMTINPEVLITAVDVVSESEKGIEGISERVESKLKDAAEKKASAVNIKDELRSALVKEPKVVKSTKEQRDAERATILASLNSEVKKSEVWDKILNKEAAASSDIVLETDFQELGSQKTDANFKKSILAFTKGALASQNMKLASITNVTISGDTIQIAVQTDTDENSVNIDTGAGTTEIPVGENAAPAPEETMPEGDLTGEGMENTMGGAGAAPGTQSWAKSDKKMQKTAQAPMGGGMSGAPGGVAATGSPEGGLPGPAPAGEPVQALTTDEAAPAGEEDIPTVGEQQMPWAICPECGSADVDVSNEDTGDIKGKCNACGAEYDAMLEKIFKFKITKPTKSKGEEGAETPETPEAPEVPALPVAAQTRVDQKTIKRIASNRQKFGHVCPACGNKNCEASVDTDGHTEFTCPSCKTPVEKDILISASSPDVSVLRVKWDLIPNVKDCDGCEEEVAKFASRIKVEKLLKDAAAKADEFPMQNCVERVARQYGGNTVASFGKCKGKLLADCVCKELQKLGFTKIRHLKKMAEVSMQKDPMDECLEEQKKKGLDVKEASSLCKCLKEQVVRKGHVSPLIDNVYAQAFGKDVMNGKDDLTVYDLMALDEIDKEAAAAAEAEVLKKQAMAEDEDIGAALPEIKVEAKKEEPKAEPKAEAKVEAKAEVKTEKTAKGECCQKCKKPVNFCKCDKGGDGEKKCEKCDCDPCTCEDESAKKEAMTMDGKRVRKSSEEVLKMASTPKKVESIEGNVEAGVPRAKATIRNEGADNIDVPMAKPSVPRSNAYMGKEQQADSMINKDLKLPDVAVDSSYMGQEKSVQSGMPAINNEIKGTVIAKEEKTVKEAKQMKEVDTVEGDVEAGVPRAKATIGHEGADNIDVPAKGPDVPIDNAYMGHEKEVQKDMPGINDEMLKQVKQSREKQLERIAAAREKEALQTASWLVANGRLAGDKATFNNAVKALSAFEIDQISVVAESLFPEKQVKKASVTEKKTVEAGHAIPAIVMEPKPVQANDKKEYVDKLSSIFTIGNSKFDKDLTIYGEKNNK